MLKGFSQSLHLNGFLHPVNHPSLQFIRCLVHGLGYFLVNRLLIKVPIGLGVLDQLVTEGCDVIACHFEHPFP
ncbi:hypothetical protein D3C75_1300790 [compost metagenome]